MTRAKNPISKTLAAAAVSGRHDMQSLARPKKRPRRQCAKCPWKTSTDPHDIPNGYCETKHQALRSSIAEPASLAGVGGALRVFACHETKAGKELPCVGWLANQLGPGNNIGLRLAVATGRISADFELDGEQHERFEDTLP